MCLQPDTVSFCLYNLLAPVHMVAFLSKLYKSSKVKGVATLTYRYMLTQMSAQLNQFL